MAIVRIAKGAEDQLDSSLEKGMRNRSGEELQIRKRLEEWGRSRFPEARQVHELVVGRGTCRADMAFVEPQRLIALEIKSGYDSADRLFTQAAMFSLAAPEVWICAETKHEKDVELVRHLMPHIGYIRAEKFLADEHKFDIRLHVVTEAKRRKPHPHFMAALLWAAELKEEAQRYGLYPMKKENPKHSWAVNTLVEKLTEPELIGSVCRQLRGRAAFWRADEPIHEKRA